MKKIETIEQFNEIMNKEKTFYIFKHSTTCPISAQAFQEYEQFLKENEAVSGYYLIVREARPLSNEIAERLEIKHESPQAFFVKDGKPVWNASHSAITKEALKNI